MEKVSVVECSTYDFEEVYLAARDALDKIDFIFPKGIKVLIKPNLMSQNTPTQNTVTHYSLIDAVCRILKERNCSILIGDSIAFYQEGLTRKAFETSLIGETAEKYGGRLVPFDEEPLVKIKDNLVGLKEIYIPKILLEADMVVDLCKLKTHGSMRLSGAIKNMFGCLPGGYKQKIHMWTKNPFELSDVFLDIHNVVKPSVSIMDAVISLDGGPSAIGKPIKTSKILASKNAAALDIAACKIIGYDPVDISTLERARARGFIESFEDVEVIGEIVPYVFKSLQRGKISTEKGKDGIFVTQTFIVPKIINSKCIMCGKCLGICPRMAIEKIDGNLIINTEKCILCYCCISCCRENAIRPTSSLMNKLIRTLRRITKI